MDAETTILFACLQNAGRSQLAAAFAQQIADERGLSTIRVLSAGSEPASKVHPQVVHVLAEL